MFCLPSSISVAAARFKAAEAPQLSQGWSQQFTESACGQGQWGGNPKLRLVLVLPHQVCFLSKDLPRDSCVLWYRSQQPVPPCSRVHVPERDSVFREHVRPTHTPPPIPPALFPLICMCGTRLTSVQTWWASSCRSSEGFIFTGQVF